MAPPDWKNFTPDSVDKSHCMARTWAGGKGGQCSKPKGESSPYCVAHAQSDKYKVHGRVDGPIPASKLAQFVAESRKPEKQPLSEEEKAARAEKRKAKDADGCEADGDEEGSAKRAKKDPNAPKRPAGGGYGCFLAANRKDFEKQCPGAAITGVAKLASTKWKEASEADKEKYQKQYEAKKAAYGEAMKTYVAPEGSAQRFARAKRAEKDPNAPKRPAGGAFGCFLAANRKDFQKQCPGAAITAVTKLASTKWKEASEADKKKYQKQYEAKKAAYDKAMASYVPPVKKAEGATEKKAANFTKQCEEEAPTALKKPASSAKVVKKAMKRKKAAW